MQTKRQRSMGFTIVELMIALSVFSTILLIGSALTIQIGALYNKGVNQANLQNATRNLLSDVSSNLQFSGSGFTPGASQSYGGVTVESFCVDNIRYSFVRNRMLGTDAAASPTDTAHVLWRDTMTTPSGCPPLDLSQASIPADSSNPDPTANGFEMVPNRVRIIDLSITIVDAGTYRINVELAYGDSNQFNIANGRCEGDRNASQFCAVSRQSTSVIRRIQ